MARVPGMSKNRLKGKQDKVPNQALAAKVPNTSYRQGDKLKWGAPGVSRGETIPDTEPDPKLKGKKGANCNREHCQKPGAFWFNHSTEKFYCTRCARDLNRANYNDAMRLYNHELCTIDPDFQAEFDEHGRVRRNRNVD